MRGGSRIEGDRLRRKRRRAKGRGLRLRLYSFLLFDVIFREFLMKVVYPMFRRIPSEVGFGGSGRGRRLGDGGSGRRI